MVSGTESTFSGTESIFLGKESTFLGMKSTILEGNLNKQPFLSFGVLRFILGLS